MYQTDLISHLECAPISLGALLSDFLLVCLPLLLVLPLSLNGGRSFILFFLNLNIIVTVELHVCKLLPELFKLVVVALYIVGVVHY